MEILKIRSVELDDLKDCEIELILEEYETTDDVKMAVNLYGITVSEKGEYYFETFQGLRDQLLQHKIGLKCYGALVNVCQSPMACYTDNIYVITLGQQALLKDLKSIFDYADVESFPSTKEQNEFYEIWIKSLGK